MPKELTGTECIIGFSASEKEPPKSNKADFRKANTSECPVITEQVLRHHQFYSGQALSKGFMNFHTEQTGSYQCSKQTLMAKPTKHKIAFSCISWRQSGLTCVGIQVLPTPSERLLRAHTMIPAPPSELCCGFHSTSRAGFGSSKIKFIKRDTKIKNSPQVKCKDCCLDYSKPPFSFLCWFN